MRVGGVREEVEARDMSADVRTKRCGLPPRGSERSSSRSAFRAAGSGTSEVWTCVNAVQLRAGAAVAAKQLSPDPFI